MLFSLFLISLMVPAVHNKPPNLRCYYLPYTTNETEDIFKVVVTECPPEEVCYSAKGRYGMIDGLIHKGCMRLEKCDSEKMITVKGVVYNTSYSCCDWSHCNTGTCVAANLVMTLVIFGSLFIMMGL